MAQQAQRLVILIHPEMGKKSKAAAKGGTDSSSSSPVDAYRSMLAEARKLYRMGRVFNALDKYREAQTYGDAHCGFPADSLVRAFCWLELGLAWSLAVTDYASGSDDWKASKKAMTTSLLQGHAVYEQRLAAGTLLCLRRDECWVEGRGLCAPVGEPERLGAVDYLSCTSLLSGALGPCTLSVAKLHRALAFVAEGHASGGWQILVMAAPQVDLGPLLPPPALVQNLHGCLQTCVDAGIVGAGAGSPAVWTGSWIAKRPEPKEDRVYKDRALEEARARDQQKYGLLGCSWPGCAVVEKHPRQLRRCSGCDAAAYCSPAHQKNDWARHKPGCQVHGRNL